MKVDKITVVCALMAMGVMIASCVGTSSVRHRENSIDRGEVGVATHTSRINEEGVEWRIRYKPHQRRVPFHFRGKVKPQGFKINWLGLVSPHESWSEPRESCSSGTLEIEGTVYQNIKLAGIPVACFESKGRRYLLTVEYDRDSAYLPSMGVYRVQGCGLQHLCGISIIPDSDESLESARVLADLDFVEGIHNTTAMENWKVFYGLAISWHYCRTSGTDTEKRLHRDMYMSLQKEYLETIVHHLTRKGTSPLYSIGDYSKYIHPVPQNAGTVQVFSPRTTVYEWVERETVSDYRSAYRAFPLGKKKELTKALVFYWKQHRSEPMENDDLQKVSVDKAIMIMEEFMKLETEEQRMRFDTKYNKWTYPWK